MKVIARVYKWIIISVILQVIILTYINSFYLNSGGSVKATVVEIEDSKPKTNMNVKVPLNADQIKVSYDGNYVSYILDDKLEIMSVKGKKVIKTLNHDRLSYTYYKWLPDRNMIIYSMKAAADQPGEVHVYTYDIDAEIDRNYPKIGNLPKGSEIVDIELSALTNVVYAKVKTAASQYRICKFDIMDTLSYVMNTGMDIVMKEAGYSDLLVYQDDRNKIFVRDGLKYSVKELPFKAKMVLLGIDAEDTVYAGELQSDKKVGTIYSGKLNADVNKQWKKVTLTHPTEPGNLILTSDGVVFRLDEQENAVYHTESNRKISYKGKFLEMTESFIVSRDKETVRIEPFKE